MSNACNLPSINNPIHTEDNQINAPSRRYRLLSRILTNKMLLIGGFIVTVLLFFALFAPYIATHDPYELHMRSKFSPPCSEFLLGTDHLGRDIFSRLVFGGRLSFRVSILAVAIGFFGGILIGALAGYIGGLLDATFMRMMDSLMAFPPLLLAIGLVAFIGPGLMTVSVAIGVVNLPVFARVMRSAVLTEKGKDYASAAKAIGQSSFKILVRHIGPSTISPVIVLATIIFAQAVLAEAAMSFLGVSGVPPTTPSWGIMLNDSRKFLFMSYWVPIWPGLAISFAVLGFNFIGDGLRDLLDPKV